MNATLPRSAKDSHRRWTNEGRVDITTGLWSLHTPLDPTKIKPRGYSNTSGGEPKTRERPQTQQEGNPFDLENRHLTP